MERRNERRLQCEAKTPDGIVPALSLAELGLPYAKGHWRCISKNGSVPTIPGFVGTLIATNDIIGVMDTLDGRRVVVHIDNLVATKQASGATKTKKQQMLMEYS